MKSRLARFAPTTRPDACSAPACRTATGSRSWPIATLVKQVSGIVDDDGRADARSKIGATMSGCEDGALAERVAAVIGVADAEAGLQETFWAIRRFLEWTGGRPLVVIFDDLQWAEPTFLDLVEYLAGWSRGVAMMLLCLTRPDLMDLRPTWGSGVANTVFLPLDPLNQHESERLVSELLGGTRLEERAFARIAESAGGNPLFLEEMLRMLEDDGLLRRENDRWIMDADPGGVRVPVDPGPDRRAPRPTVRRRAPRDPLGIGGREGLLVGRGRGARAVIAVRARRQRVADTRPQGSDPAGGVHARGRGRVPLRTS